MTGVRAGLFPPNGQPHTGGPEQLHAMPARVAENDVDHICVGDYVSFFLRRARTD